MMILRNLNLSMRTVIKAVDSVNGMEIMNMLQIGEILASFIEMVQHIGIFFLLKE